MAALHALKDPMSIALVTRYRPQTHNSPPRDATSRRLLTTTSKVLAALDTQREPFDTGGDESIEIIGPIPLVNTKGKTPIPKNIGSSKQIHSIFSKGGTPLLKSIVNVDAVKIATPLADAIENPKPLPNYSYKDFSPEPAIVYTQHEEEANDLVQALRGFTAAGSSNRNFFELIHTFLRVISFSPLGFDMEWRVLFRVKAPERPTALVQVSDENMVLLIQISSMSRFPQKLKEVIESNDVIKMGANIHNDGQKLFRDYGILARNLVELGSLARQADPDFVQAFGSKRSVVGLARVVARYCGKTLVKGKERTGNWEAVLKPSMIEYAANDAHCALMAYKKLMCMAAANAQTLTPAGYTSHVTPFRIPTSETSSSASTLTTRSSASTATGVAFVRPQFMRAYQFWHRDNLPLERICAQLRSKEEPLKHSTVISYVVGALQADPSLPFKMERLKALVQMESGSWRRHREWIFIADEEGRGKQLISSC